MRLELITLASIVFTLWVKCEVAMSVRTTSSSGFPPGSFPAVLWSPRVNRRTGLFAFFPNRKE